MGIFNNEGTASPRQGSQSAIQFHNKTSGDEMLITGAGTVAHEQTPLEVTIQQNESTMAELEKVVDKVRSARKDLVNAHPGSDYHVVCAATLLRFHKEYLSLVNLIYRNTAI